MALLNERNLGRLIFMENPYTTGYVPIGFVAGAPAAAAMQPDDVYTEKQLDVGSWTFKGAPHHIERAIRVAYTYTDVETGSTIRDYILIGYEGGGAY